MRYRGDGSPRSTSSITPERGRRSVDSDSATTRLPTSKAMAIPSAFVLPEDSSPRIGCLSTPVTQDQVFPEFVQSFVRALYAQKPVTTGFAGRDGRCRARTCDLLRV